MYDKIRILVAYDESLQSSKALKEAISIAKHFSGFIKVVNVYGKGKEKEAEMTISKAKQDLEKEDVSYDVSLVLSSNPAKTLGIIAKQENFGLIVIGNRGLGSKLSYLLGSVSKQVVAEARCNVLIVKN
jgi:nucleotide-binding universal stress UspA family protein